MRITSLGQNSAHKDHNHMVLLGISTSLARCVGNIQIIHTDPLWSYKPTLHKIVMAELYASSAGLLLSVESSAPREVSSGQANTRWSSQQATPIIAIVFLLTNLIFSCHKIRIPNWVSARLWDKPKNLFIESLCFSSAFLSRPKKTGPKMRLVSKLPEFFQLSLAGLRNTSYLQHEHACCLQQWTCFWK